MMSSEDIVMTIKKPHFTVKLHETLLEVDLNEGARKKLEDVLEAKPAIRESLGFIFQTIIPHDVALKDIEAVKVDKKGQVQIVIPHRRDLHIPLTSTESKKLVEKMNELIGREKERVLKDQEESKKTRRALEPERARAEAGAESLGRVGR